MPCRFASSGTVATSRSASRAILALNVASNFLRDLVISVLHRLRQSRTLHTLTFGPISGVHFISGTIPHVARGLSRVCPALRITLMFKAERLFVEDKYRAFLVDELRLNRVQHSGRDFYTHLVGTYALLRTWGTPEPVCL